MKMEHAIGAISEGEWNNCGGIMYPSSTTEEADFMAQLLGNCSLPNENPSSSTFLAACWPVPDDGRPNMEIASVEETSIYSTNDNNRNDVTNNTNMFYYFSQNSSYSNHNNEMYARSDQPYVFEGGSNSKDDTFMESGDNFLNPQDSSNDSMEYSDEKKGDDDEQNGLMGVNLQLGIMEHQVVLPLPESSSADEKVSSSRDNSLAKKRPPTHGNKNKRNVKPKRSQRVDLSSENGDKENANNNKPILQRQNSTLSYCSEYDSNVSMESDGGATTTTSSTSKRGGAANQTNGKTRASRGSATDPQSLYARKRREKINERLRILQNLVPNGTKVDISTMLEEAVKYVNFLQLQIKLLSSDDLWMYAPIAYNGMDMGLDLKIASHNLSQ